MADPAPKPEEEQPPRPPTADELPYEDGVPLESSKHRAQIDLLVGTLSLHWRDRDDFFVGGNMFLYFSALQSKRNDFRGPDFFAVLGTENRHRKSWVVWEEEQGPDVIVEITSPSTRDEDYTRKKRVYGRILRVPYYYIFDPFEGDLAGFRLDVARADYGPLEQGAHGRLPCERLGLELGVWGGSYRNQPGPWLRWFTPGGELVPTPEEQAEQEAARAEQEAARAEQEAARAEQEAARAEQEAARADTAEARIAALEAQLRALRGE